MNAPDLTPAAPMVAIPARTQGASKRQRVYFGFTLLEVMVGMTTFMMIGVGTIGGLLQARRLSQLNILRNAAYTVAQGYMEQMMSVNPADLEAASEPWVTSRPPIPTESVNSLLSNTTNIEVSDPLYVSPLATSPAGANMTARADVPGDMWNNKLIMVDLSAATASGNVANYTVTNMNERLDVNISRAWTQVGGAWQVPQSPTQPGYFLIKIDFQFMMGGYTTGNVWFNGTIRAARCDVAGP